MPLVSLGEAARLTGHGKSTIARSIKSGRLSATRTEFGSYEIDTSELFRVYPFKAPVDPDADTAETDAAVQHTTPDTIPVLLAEANAQVAALRQVSELLRAQLEDVKEDRDQWREQAKRVVLPPPESAPPPRSKWWWGRRTG